MEQLKEKIERYKKEVNAEPAAGKDAAEQFRIKYLGSKGIVKNIMGEMKQVPAAEKKEAGQLLNDFKLFVEQRYETLKSSVEDATAETAAGVDVTLPGQ